MSSRVNLGPLTTTFTAASSCSSLVQQSNYGLCSTCILGYAGQKCSAGINHDNPDCWPPRSYSAQSTPSVGLFGWGYYSPGIYCPAGYATACSSSAGGGDFTFQFPPINAETAVGCCPSGYGCATIGDNTQTCMATFSTALTILTCSSSTSDVFTTVTSGSLRMYAPMIQLIRDGDDLSAYGVATSASTTAMATDTSTASTGTGTGTQASAGDTASAVASATATASSDGPPPMSSGTKAGIAVGVVAGIAMLLVAFLYAFRLRRRLKELDKKIELDEQQQKQFRTTVQYGVFGMRPPVEMPTTAYSMRSEMSDTCARPSPEALYRSPASYLPPDPASRIQSPQSPTAFSASQSPVGFSSSSPHPSVGYSPSPHSPSGYIPPANPVAHELQ